MWIYDNNGSYIGFTYNGVEYYYVYNLQGDVEAITDATGAIVAKYGYDTWGYVEYEFNYNGSINIAEINPIRYRGYYYDSERGLYYLNSRYYDPFMCRFLNADGYVSTGQGVTGFNMFAYCGNNPVNRADPSGQFWGIVGIVIVVCLALTSCSKSDTNSPSDNSNINTNSSSGSTTSKGDYNEFKDALGMRESSNDYSAKNRYGYLGKYQLGTLALQDAGFKDSSGNWTNIANSYGVYSNDDFLNNPSCQEAAIESYHKKLCGYIRNYDLDSYVGKTYDGVIITRSGLLASCHLVGVGTMKKSLANGYVAEDANKVKASEYMDLFGGYDISDVW